MRVGSRTSAPRSEFRRSPRREKQFAQTQRRLALALRTQREALHLTQERAAERIGIHPVTYARIERGEFNPTLATLCAIADAFGVDLGKLLSGRSAG